LNAGELFINPILDVSLKAVVNIFLYATAIGFKDVLVPYEGAGYYPQAGIHFLTGLKLIF
jgi:hypothetical protein